MTPSRSLLLAALVASPAFAEGTRELDAHEHGVGELNIAIDGDKIAMEFHAPGADIVGFEYEAESDADIAAIDAAIGTLSKPLDLFALPAAAECTVLEAAAELETEEAHEDHDEHDHDKHAEGEDHDHDHDHDKHADGEEHDHDKHAEGEDHDHDHDEHAEEASHTEFHAEYLLTCGNIGAASKLTFAYFDMFENAREVEVQVVSSKGAQAFEVERDAPTLDLGGVF